MAHAERTRFPAHAETPIASIVSPRSARDIGFVRVCGMCSRSAKTDRIRMDEALSDQ